MSLNFLAIPRAALVCSIMALLLSCNSGQTASEKKEDIDQYRAKEGQSMVARGQYLVTVGGCNDCHSPKQLTPQGPEVDTAKRLSGHPAAMPLPPFTAAALKPGNWIQMAPDLTAYVGPWGVSYAANLTPDTTTGLGAWTEDVFIKTLRTGKHLGQDNGRPILPPMPWQEFARMSDDDLKAVYAYLRSLPAINNKVPAPVSPPDAAKMAK